MVAFWLHSLSRKWCLISFKDDPGAVHYSVPLWSGTFSCTWLVSHSFWCSDCPIFVQRESLQVSSCVLWTLLFDSFLSFQPQTWIKPLLLRALIPLSGKKWSETRTWRPRTLTASGCSLSLPAFTERNDNLQNV